MQVIRSGKNDVLKLLSPRVEAEHVYRPSSYLMQLKSWVIISWKELRNRRILSMASTNRSQCQLKSV